MGSLCQTVVRRDMFKMEAVSNLIIYKLIHLKLKFHPKYMGSWCLITRANFDLFMLGEPYHSLEMLINLDTSEYIFRVLGTSRLRGEYASIEELEGLLISTFS